MSSITVHQLSAGFAAGDAISHEALALRDICRELGFNSDIFVPADHIEPDTRAACRPLSEYAGEPGDVVIGHYSIASPVLDSFSASPARKALIYHNITPPEFFAPFDDQITAQLTEARQQLPAIARQAEMVWADSAFNAAELQSLGVKSVRVFPLIFPAQKYDVPPDPVIRAHFNRPMKNILFVGRIAPNKCLEELIAAFASYQTIEPQSRLLIVGSARSAPAYWAMLRMYAGELDQPNICFENFVAPASLSAYYSLADLFVTTSRHEGFCLPVLEAMDQNIPVIARRTGGIPEAMNGAGVMFDDGSPDELAELFAEVLNDATLRQTILQSQQERIRSVRQRPVREEVLALLSDLIPRG